MAQGSRTIRSLTVVLVARTKQYIDGLKKGERATSKFGRQAKKTSTTVGALNKSFASFSKTLIGLAAAGGGIAALTRTMQTLDRIGKTADKLGVTTESLIALRHAAELTGVASNTVDMALQRMTRRMAEAAKGTGEARNAIAELGLDAQRLATMGPVAAFGEVAEAMKRVENQADKVRLSFKLFDSEGVAMVNTLRLGKKGLADAAAETRNLGMALDRAAIKKIEEANEAMMRLKMSFAGLGATIATDVVGPLKSIIDLLTRLSKYKGVLTAGAGVLVGGALAGKTGALIAISVGVINMIYHAAEGYFDEVYKKWAKKKTWTPKKGKAPVVGDANDPVLARLQEKLHDIEHRKIDKAKKALRLAIEEYRAANQKKKGLRGFIEKYHPLEMYPQVLVNRIKTAAQQSLELRQAEHDKAYRERRAVKADIRGRREQLAHDRAAVRAMKAARLASVGRAISSAMSSILSPTQTAGGKAISGGNWLSAQISKGVVAAENQIVKTIAIAAKRTAATEQAKDIFEAMRTPLERIKKDYEDIQRLHKIGAFAGAGGEETYRRAIADIIQRARGLLPEKERATYQRQRPGLVQAGTMAAWEAIQRSSPALTEQQKQTKELKKQTELQRGTNEFLEKIADETGEVAEVGL